ncbi:MAG: hypothetical protein ACREO3_07070, partial [Arenimonas sp.]
HYLVLQELQGRAGGMPVDNRETDYSGFGDDVAFNKGVHRYRGDVAAMQMLSGDAALTGRIDAPLVIQYNNNDPTVPGRYHPVYRALVGAVGGKMPPLVLPPVGDGHCDFSPAQVREAFRNLTDWSNSGVRPASP